MRSCSEHRSVWVHMVPAMPTGGGVDTGGQLKPFVRFPAAYLGRVPQDRAAARARAAEEGLAASAKQLLAEAAAEALRSQVRPGWWSG